MEAFGLCSFFDQIRVAAGFAGLVDRFIPRDKITFGVATAAIESPAAFASAFDDLAVASFAGAGNTG